METVWTAYVASTGRNRCLLTEQRKRLIRRRVREYHLDDVLAAVRGWQHIAWNRGDNPQQRVYNDIELLLRDAAHIERFRDAALDAEARVPRKRAEPREWRRRRDRELHLVEVLRDAAARGHDGRAAAEAEGFTPVEIAWALDPGP